MVFPGASLGITPTVQTASVASLTGCRKLCLAHMSLIMTFWNPGVRDSVGSGFRRDYLFSRRGRMRLVQVVYRG